MNSHANEPPTEAIDTSRLYRAFVEPADDRGTELTVFVEASTRAAALDRIAQALGAIHGEAPATVIGRIYNLDSARDLAARNFSDDRELRLFETGWSNGRPSFYVPQPLFLVRKPAALTRKWSTLGVHA